MSPNSFENWPQPQYFLLDQKAKEYLILNKDGTREPSRIGEEIGGPLEEIGSCSDNSEEKRRRVAEKKQKSRDDELEEQMTLRKKAE